MAELHEIIDELCTQRGITGYKMSVDLGLSKSLMTELRKGRSKSLKTETAAKIAGYFGVSVDYLLGKEEKKETLASKGERPKSKLRSIARLEDSSISPEQDEKIADYIDFLLSKRQKDL